MGAGRRRRAAGAPVRRRRRQAGRRSLRRARRQDRAARAGRRARHRGRPLGEPARRACATISRGSACTAEMVAADATEWQGGPFDAVLLDAPCSSTGTIRRHPDVAWLKSEADLAQLDRPAAPPARPRGRADQAGRHASSIASARSSPRKASSRSRRCWRASRASAASRSRPDEIAGIAEFLTPDRRFAHPAEPLDAIRDPRMGGLDGFFAARLERI